MDIALLMILVMAKVAYIFALSCLAGLAIFTAGAILALLIRWYVGLPDDGDFCARQRP